MALQLCVFYCEYMYGYVLIYTYATQSRLQYPHLYMPVNCCVFGVAVSAETLLFIIKKKIKPITQCVHMCPYVS